MNDESNDTTDTVSKPLTPDQLSAVDAALSDPRSFLFRRLFEAIIVKDTTDGYNSFLTSLATGSTQVKLLELAGKLLPPAPADTGKGGSIKDKLSK